MLCIHDDEHARAGGAEFCGKHGAVLRADSKGKFVLCTVEFTGVGGGIGLSAFQDAVIHVYNSTLRVGCVLGGNAPWVNSCMCVDMVLCVFEQVVEVYACMLVRLWSVKQIPAGYWFYWCCWFYWCRRCANVRPGLP